MFSKISFREKGGGPPRRFLMDNQLSINEEQDECTRFQFPALVEDSNIEVDKDVKTELMYVSLEISVQLGKTNLRISDILNLSEKPEEIDLNDLDLEERKKYLIELDKGVGEPINLLINGHPFATGEVISSQKGDNYRIRIVSILSDEGTESSSKAPEEI